MQNKYERWQALDSVKAVGVLLMIILHVAIWWYIPLDYGGDRVPQLFYLFLPVLKFIGLFVIILPITAGASLRFYFRDNIRNNFALLKNKKPTRVIKRAFLLICLGYLLNFLAWGKDEFLDWICCSS